MANPLISVIIPAYNCGRFVSQTVRSALDQTVGDLEVLLIDDASADNTWEVLTALAAEDPRIRLLRNDGNLGVAETRNRGAREARGRYIALLDADDLWLPQKLERQLAALEQAGADLCYTAYSFVDETGQPVGHAYRVPETVSFDELLRENVIGCSTVLLRAELLRQHPMNPAYAHEDYVLWLDLLRAEHRAVGVDQPLMRYRRLQTSRSGDKRKAAQNRWIIYRRHLRLPLFRSAALFLHYAARGLQKHRTRP